MPCFVASVPFGSTGSENVNEQFNRITRNLSVKPTAFEVPPLKVGTLDNLMECSDDLVKIDSAVETLTFKVLSILQDISGSSDLAVVTKPTSGGAQQAETTDEHLAKFKWNEAQYPINKPLKQLIGSIQEAVSKGEENIRTRLSDYNDIKTKLTSIKKKSGGTLAVRPIAQDVREWYQRHNESGPLESEYMTTVLVVIPNADEKKWLKEYATFDGAEMVVPDSSKLILKEGELSLYNVIVFKKIVDDYKNSIRSRKYVIREYTPEEDVSNAQMEEMNEELETKKNSLIRWLKNTFSECYTGWVHLKAIRVFVESILRYGLPPAFVAMLFNVDSKKEKEVRKQLASMYSDLAPKKFGMEEEDTIAALEQQYPYVSLKVRSHD